MARARPLPVAASGPGWSRWVRLTGLDPHVIDAAIKIVPGRLRVFLIRYAALWLSPIGTLAVAALYFMLTAAAYSSEGYSIYYTNDFLMVAGWNAAITLIALDQWALAALVVFLTAWAKETVVLIPVLALFAWRRGKATRAHLVLVGAAFMIPTAILRTYYPAPLTEWVPWHNARSTCLLSSTHIIRTAIKDNVKPSCSSTWAAGDPGDSHDSRTALARTGTGQRGGIALIRRCSPARVVDFPPLLLIVLLRLPPFLRSSGCQRDMPTLMLVVGCMNFNDLRRHGPSTQHLMRTGTRGAEDAVSCCGAPSHRVSFRRYKFRSRPLT